MVIEVLFFFVGLAAFGSLAFMAGIQWGHEAAYREGRADGRWEVLVNRQMARKVDQ
jgi:hypothetical protein